MLYVLGGTVQLLGVVLVLLDVSDGRQAAQEWLVEANQISEAQKDFRFSVGPADVKADWALRLMEALKEKLAANVERRQKADHVGRRARRRWRRRHHGGQRRSAVSCALATAPG